MNCKQLNSIGMEEVLAFLGHLPTRQNEKEAWYLSPFGAESHASFKVDRRLNLWYLFSEGVGGTNTDFMQKYLNTTVKGVLDWASEQVFSSFHQQINSSIRKVSPEYRIEKAMDLHHPNLIDYLQTRGLSSKIHPYVKEIWFSIKEKPYYALGFKNRSGGWELRNAYYKGALLNKDISILHINPAVQNAEHLEVHHDNDLPVSHDGIPACRIAVVEGFVDALSLIEMKGSYQGDLLVLNSVSLLKKAIDYLKRYTQISLLLDNDAAGRKCTQQILKAFPYAKDFSHLYHAHKDLNGYLMEKRQRQSLSALKTEPSTGNEKDKAEKQESWREETNSMKKGVRRRM
ncbi:toprim domain-containing protein [Chryseobacterium sp. KMC2]|uniref:toprim domain-containing protein n=1 Tax=Chryseobacterium sp. KMC2 TaxID=2800705 RepID=UPI0019242B81|nr:toprim domain-containing protein [Chryseobacterium sp. KMC2]MBL3545955.1 toprim domain-containing protein [Chryseobacterium sp. KMC2]